MQLDQKRWHKLGGATFKDIVQLTMTQIFWLIHRRDTSEIVSKVFGNIMQHLK